MNTALATRTRDGMPSVAAMLEQDQEEWVPAEPADVAAWARENKLMIDRSLPILDQVNAARMSHGLPRMRVQPRQGARPADPAPAPPAARDPDPSWSAIFPGGAIPTGPFPIAATEDELLGLVLEHDGTLTGLVTSTVAEWLLKINTGNRPLSKGGVDRFVALLRSGGFMNTGEPIIVSREGVLNEGQHRLTAIQRSGIGAVLDVRFGISREAFAATGTGARRTVGNVLAIAGKSHASMQAAIGRLLVHHAAGEPHRFNQQVEPQTVIAATEAEPALGDIAALIRSLKFKPARTAPFGFALLLAQKASSLSLADTFAHLVDSGKADEDDATRRLHVRLRDAAMAKERMHQVDIAVLTIRAWNAWIVDKPVQLLRVTDADRTGEGFPKVVSRG